MHKSTVGAEKSKTRGRRNKEVLMWGPLNIYIYIYVYILSIKLLVETRIVLTTFQFDKTKK